MRLLSLTGLLLFLAVAHSQSVKSCGSPSDHFKNASFSVNPDPIDKNKPLTITGTGTLDELIQGGSLNIDLNIKALGIINEPVKKTAPFSLSPGLPAGPQKLVIGPFNLPKIPGSADITGKITGMDSQGQPVFCVALDINAISDEVPSPSASEAILLPQVGAGPISDCGSSSDHLKNRTVSDTGGVLKASGDLDEAVASGEVDVNLEVKVSFFKIPIVTNVPFTISPAIAQGPLKLSIGPAKDASESEVASPNIKVKVDGTVKITDSKKEEIACVAVNVD